MEQDELAAVEPNARCRVNVAKGKECFAAKSLQQWIERRPLRVARKSLRGFPVVALTGPRQSGKTTLACPLSGARPCASLEDPDIREYAQSDPRGFLVQFPDGAVLDEVQPCPALFSYLQGRANSRARDGGAVAENRNHAGGALNMDGSDHRGANQWRTVDRSNTRTYPANWRSGVDLRLGRDARG